MFRRDCVEKSNVGDRVRFTNPNAGYDCDIAFSREAGLIVYEVYEIAKIIVHDWHTELWLRGKSGPFNSVQFSTG